MGRELAEKNFSSSCYTLINIEKQQLLKWCLLEFLRGRDRQRTNLRGLPPESRGYVLPAVNTGHFNMLQSVKRSCFFTRLHRLFTCIIFMYNIGSCSDIEGLCMAVAKDAMETDHTN